MNIRSMVERVRWEPVESWALRVGDAPIVVGCDDRDVSLRAVEAAAQAAGRTGTVVLACAARRRRRSEPQTFLHDVLKSEAYLLTGEAILSEQLRRAREVAVGAGAGTVTTCIEVGDPVSVLCRVAEQVGAGAVVVGRPGRRPGAVAHAVSRRTGRELDVIVTDGAEHLLAVRPAPERVTVMPPRTRLAPG